MALSLRGGRRRWCCRAARRVKGGAACHHFHVHYHIPRQVWPSSPLRYLLTLPVLFFAVLALLVCFGWFTLVYLVSSLWSRSLGRSVDADEPGGGGSDEEEERVVWPVTEHAGDSSSSEVCVEGRVTKEVFEDGLPEEESRYKSRMASTGICVECDEPADHEKIVKEVLERNGMGLKAFTELDGSKEKHQLVMDIPNDSFLEKLNTKEFSSSAITAGLFDVLSIGQKFAENKKEMSVLSSLEILEFIDKHDAAEVVVNGGAGTDFVIAEVTSSGDSASDGLRNETTKEKNQEQSIAEISVNIVDKRLPENVIDEWQEGQNLATEHNNKLPEAVSNEEYRDQVVGLSDEAHDCIGEMAGLPLDSVRQNMSEKSPFHLPNSDIDSELQEDLIPTKRLDSSTSAAAVCDFADNHWRIMEELDGFANEENVQDEASPGTSILGTVEDEEEDNNCAIGAPRRLALVQRSPAPWWNLCGVLDVFAGDEV